MVTLTRHARYALPDGTVVMARCWESGLVPPQWKLHTNDDQSTPLYHIDGDCILRYVWDVDTNEQVSVLTDLVLDDLRPI
jgi:hypothetical protein